MKALLTCSVAATALLLASCAHSAPPVPGAWGSTGKKGNVSSFTLSINPSSKTVSRVGTGSLSTSVNYVTTGGVGAIMYSTVAPGLTITNGTTSNPSFAATLTVGQDINFPITATANDSAGNTVNAFGNIEFIATAAPPPGLSLVVTPSSQTVSRNGAGTLDAVVDYTASGGVGPPYFYATSAPGLTVAGGTTTHVTLTASLTNGQVSNYAPTVTLTDGTSTPAVVPFAIQYTSNSTNDPLIALNQGIVGDNLMQTAVQSPSNNVAPYTRKPKVNYGTSDYQFLGASPGMGFTYFRIPIDVVQLLSGLPLPTSYLQNVAANNAPPVYTPLTTNQTKTVSTTPPLIGSAGCGDLFMTNACFVEFNLQYLDSTIADMVAAGFAVNLVPFMPTNEVMPVNCQDTGGNPITCPAGGVVAGKGQDLHDAMGSGTCYGFVAVGSTGCYEAMLQAANMVLVNRYGTPSGKGYDAKTVFFEFNNEPDYKSSGGSAWQNIALYNQYLIDQTAQIRAVDTTHWLIVDGGAEHAKAESLAVTVPVDDTQPGTVYSFHKYDPSSLVTQGSGAIVNPYTLFPAPGSGDAAIGRPGGVITNNIPFPAPVFGSPSYTNFISTVTATPGCADSVPAFVGTPPTTVWAASAGVPLTAHGEKVCETTAGNNKTTSFSDMYSNSTGGSSYQISTSQLLASYSGVTLTGGIQMALNWAAAGGHTGPTSAKVLKIIAGEIGATRSGDYLSVDQIFISLRNTLDHAAVVGGQNHVPWDFWSLSGVQFAMRPKAGVPTYTHFCFAPGQVANGANYDLDIVAIFKTPQDLSSVPNCSGGAGVDFKGYTTPGYN